MSQSQDILNYMKSHSITPVEAFNKFGCFRLAARIKDLKDDGHKISTNIVEKNGKRFARYILLKEKK